MYVLTLGPSYTIYILPESFYLTLPIYIPPPQALDKLYIGPEIEMNLKYAAILTLVFVDMTYSATCPLFNFITFMNLMVIYVSDKYMLFHLFKKPPVLNAALPRWVFMGLRMFVYCVYVSFLICVCHVISMSTPI